MKYYADYLKELERDPDSRPRSRRAAAIKKQRRQAEIRTARNLFATLFRKRAEDQYFDVSSRTLPGDATRVSRVFYFSQVARGASDLGMKIAGYVTCFEALFCTESAELAWIPTLTL